MELPCCIPKTNIILCQLYFNLKRKKERKERERKKERKERKEGRKKEKRKKENAQPDANAQER